jgi:hypothetical protein
MRRKITSPVFQRVKQLRKCPTRLAGVLSAKDFVSGNLDCCEMERLVGHGPNHLSRTMLRMIYIRN